MPEEYFRLSYDQIRHTYQESVSDPTQAKQINIIEVLTAWIWHHVTVA
jgi:hypothetical protein